MNQPQPLTTWLNKSAEQNLCIFSEICSIMQRGIILNIVKPRMNILGRCFFSNIISKGRETRPHKMWIRKVVHLSTLPDSFKGLLWCGLEMQANLENSPIPIRYFILAQSAWHCVHNTTVKLSCAVQNFKRLWRKNRGHGPTRYVKLRVVHGPGMPGTFSASLTSKETAS